MSKRWIERLWQVRRRRHGAGLGIVLVGAIAFLCWNAGVKPIRARQAPGALSEVFVAPNPLPIGAQELWIGSLKRLPEGTEVLALGGATELAKVERLSAHALRVELAAPADAGRMDLRIKAGDEEVDVPVGVDLGKEALALAVNIPEEDLARGGVHTNRDVFIYGFAPGQGVDLAGVRILNASTGEWHFRDLEMPAEKDLNDPALHVDSDADGVLDLHDPDRVSPAAPAEDFLGINLRRGANELRIVTFDRLGGSRVEHLTAIYSP